MLVPWWRAWTSRTFFTGRTRSRSRGGRRPAKRTLRLEALEDRVVPSSSPLQPLAVPNYRLVGTRHDGAKPDGSTSPQYFTPAQIDHAYGIDQIKFSNGTVIGDGTGETVAIVDAFDDPNILHDVQAFSSQFGLTQFNGTNEPTFTKLAQDGSTNYPAPNSGWITEIALDCEWVHAIAPGANILLVEANDNSFTNLNTAVDYARNATGVVAVTMSYGGGEFSSETSYDSHFTTPSGHPGVTFLSSTGDSGAPGGYQAFSPNVVGVGGTVLQLNSSNNISSETGWNGSGGGISLYESQPAYQKGVVTQSTTKRTIPDVSIIGGTPVSVYESYNNGTAAPWIGVYGTSLSSPSWAGLIAIVDQGRALINEGSLDGPSQTLPALYQLPSGDFHDITSGNNGYAAGTGYDLVTGRGSPVANLLVPDLVNAPVLDTWTGGGPDSNWSDGLNWASGVAPNPGDTLVFGPGAAQSTATNDFAAGTSFGSIRFTSKGYTINGNDVTLTQGLDGSGSTGTNTFNLNVTAGAALTFVGAGSSTSLVVGGTINDAGYTLQVTGGVGGVTLAGVVSGTGALTDNVTGTLTLSGANTYSGGTTLGSSGTLALANNGALGNGGLTWNSGALQASGGAIAIGNAVTVGGNVTVSGSQSLTFSGAVTLTGTRTFTVSSTGTTSFSGGVGQSGTGALTKSGNGVLVLPVADAYSGGTTITAGTLTIGDPGALGTGTLTFTGGTLQGNGTALTLTNAVTVAGTATLGGSTALTFSGPVTLTGNRTLTVNNSTTLSGTLGQSGGTWGFTKAGSGTLILSASNTYGGTTTLSAGTLGLTSPSAISAATLVLNGGTLTASGAALTLANAITLGGSVTLGGSFNLTFNGLATLTASRTLTVSNTGTTTFAGGIGQSTTAKLTKGGSGLLVLPVADSFTGGFVLSGGTVQAGDPGSLGSGTITLSSGSLEGTSAPLTFTNAVTVAGGVTLTGTAPLTFSGAITLTGTRTLTVNTNETVTLSGAIGQSGGTYGFSKGGSGTLIVSGTNTYGGTTTLTAGTLAVTNSAALGSGTLALSGGTFEASGGTVSLSNAVTLGGNATIGGGNDLTFTGAATLTGNRTLTVTSTGTTTFAGAVGQSTTAKLTKAGAGLLVLAGTNTFTGGTGVTAGTLLVNGSLSSTGAVSVSSGATLGGSGTVGGAVTVSAGGTLMPGSASATAILSSGKVTLNSNSNFNVTLNDVTAGTGYDQLDVTGALSLGGSKLNVTLGTGFTPAVGTVFTLITGQTGAVTGTFSGLPEGGTLTINGMTFTISYVGGSGNDVTLTRTA